MMAVKARILVVDIGLLGCWFDVDGIVCGDEERERVGIGLR